MPIIVFLLPRLYASDWYLLAIIVPLFFVGIWLLYGELRKWAQQQAEGYRSPSAIGKLLISIFGVETRPQFEQRDTVEAKPQEELHAAKKAA